MNNMKTNKRFLRRVLLRFYSELQEWGSAASYAMRR